MNTRAEWGVRSRAATCRGDERGYCAHAYPVWFGSVPRWQMHRYAVHCTSRVRPGAILWGSEAAAPKRQQKEGPAEQLLVLQ